jgi:hypothetical protein
MDLRRKKATKVHEYYKYTKRFSNVEMLDYLKIIHAYGHTKTPFNDDFNKVVELTDPVCISIIHSNIDNIHV